MNAGPGWYQMGWPTGRIGWWNGHSWELPTSEPTQGSPRHRSRDLNSLLAHRFTVWEIAGVAAIGLAMLSALAAYAAQGSVVARLGSMLGFMLGMLLLILACLLYFLPGITATRAKHKNASAIWALNFLLGWTMLGWVVAFVWALTDPSKSHTQMQPMPVVISTNQPIKPGDVVNAYVFDGLQWQALPPSRQP